MGGGGGWAFGLHKWFACVWLLSFLGVMAKVQRRLSIGK